MDRKVLDQAAWVKLAAAMALMIGATAWLYQHGVSREQIQLYVHSFGWWAPAVYFGLYAQPLVPLPASVMFMAGGLTFGFGGGVLAALAAATARACGQFLLARTCGRQIVESWLARRAWRLEQWFGSRQAFRSVLLIRVLPNLPYDLQNIGLGLSSVSFRIFVVATVLGTLPSIVLWAYVGHTLSDSGLYWKLMAVFLGAFLLWSVRSRFRQRTVAGS